MPVRQSLLSDFKDRHWRPSDRRGDHNYSDDVWRRASEKAPVRARSLVEAGLALTQRELEANRILLRNDLPDELPAVLRDRVQLQQVLSI